MQLGRYQVSTLRPPPILSITFSQDGRLFAVAGEAGYEVWRTWPLNLVRKRALPGTLARVVLLPNSPLVVLQGGGASPLYPPNKAVVFHDGLGAPVAELEFGERIRGIAVRHSTICIALLRRVVAFSLITSSGVHGKGKAKDAGESLRLQKVGEWETAENELGLLALATAAGSTLLALPGRQPGHVQLVNLVACPGSSSSSLPIMVQPSPFRSPIILAHTHPLSTLSCAANGSHIVTTSERGTLLRLWDTARGRLERELRRGVDRAEIWGAQLEDAVFPPAEQGSGSQPERRGGRVVGWSDKGTVHVWADGNETTAEATNKSSTPPSAPSLAHLLSRNLPLPKYFSSAPSFAQYHLPRKNPHAYASTIGAAAAATGVPSLRMSEGAGEDLELSERFVVGWVEVVVEDEEVPDGDTRLGAAAGPKKRVSIGGTTRPGGGGQFAGSGLGNREERRSFGSGSDGTSRTATPTLRTDSADRAEVPSLARRPSAILPPQLSHERSQPHLRAGSGRARPNPTRTLGRDTAKASTPRVVERQTKTERQLVAITYSGDWYRLRIPDVSASVSEGEEKKSAKCVLVEYRRLSAGGGGW